MTHQTIQGKTALRILLTLDDMRKLSEGTSGVPVRSLMVRYGILHDRMLSQAWAEHGLEALAEHQFCECTEEADTGKIITGKIMTNGIEATARVRSLSRSSQKYLELLPPREQLKYTNVVDFIEASRSHLRPATA